MSAIDFFFGIKFFPCLIIATLLLAKYLPRRRYFVLKLLFSFAACTTFSAFMWQAAKSGTFLPDLGKFKFIICNFIFFFQAVGIICLCFECTFFQSVLYVCCGWCVEHISKAVCTLIALLLGVEGIAYNYNVEYFVITVLGYLVCYCMAFITFFKVHKNSEINLDKKKLIIPTLILLLTVVIIEIYLPGVFYSDTAAMVTVKLYALACCAGCLTLMLNIFESGRYRRELDVLEELERKRREHYEISKQSIELINVKCHDLKKMLDSGLKRKGILSDEEVSSLSSQLSIYDSIVATGNDALDLVLTEKSLYCEKNEIKLTLMADGESISFLTDMEVYSLFGNILDNAVEAVMRLPADKRVVTLNVKKTGEMLCVHEENYFEGNMRYQDGAPVTSKRDSRYHGFGVMSIRRVAEKFGGGVKITADDDVFKLDVLIPLPQTRSAIA